MDGQERPLRQWPAYAEKAVIYQIFLRSFTLEGTLKAAEKCFPTWPI